MWKNIILIALINYSVLSFEIDYGQKDCTDCANGYKIITDLYFCKGIFGEPNCEKNEDCLKDFQAYQLCAFTGCFGDMSNFSSINEYNNCLKNCPTTTEPIKAYAKGMFNCMDVAESSRLKYNLLLLLLISFFILF